MSKLATSIAALMAGMLVAVIGTAPLTTSAGASPAHAARSGCADRYSAVRDPDNPLLLPTAPGRADPLRGARFFVDGPRHGAAAGAIARLLGIDAGTPTGQPLTSFAEDERWRTFEAYVSRRLRHAPGALAFRIHMLEKIASEPDTQRVSYYSQGGSPAGIYGQTAKLFCHNFLADPGTVPLINTYFLHAALRGCPTSGAIDAYRPRFRAQIDAMAAAIGHRPAVLLLEFDAIGSSSCIARSGGLPAWESLLRYEAVTLGGLPHTVVYLEGGYSDANDPRYTARILRASGIHSVEGFFTNDTHENWTAAEIHYAEAVSRLAGGAHFIVNTAQNGNGPKRNPHPATQGNTDLCNPPGRALGPRPTTSTGHAGLDALLWAAVPGNSSGCGGGPPAGIFWPARAIGLAARANARLGPHQPSRPY